MSEKLEVYDLEGNLIGISEREAFYEEIKAEFKSKGSISKKVKSVRIFVLTPDGRIYLQKRSRVKSENPGLYDKTIGGHVSALDSYDLTLVKECAEELGFPGSVVSESEFKSALQNVDLSVVGIFRKVDLLETFMSKRIALDGSIFEQPFITQVFFGYYSGSIQFKDGEACAIETFSVDELSGAISARPDDFTQDVKDLFEKYKELFVPIN
jgi:isopentenyldiphosphate isomerase